jgi:hypothetical protein
MPDFYATHFTQHRETRDRAHKDAAKNHHPPELFRMECVGETCRAATDAGKYFLELAKGFEPLTL